VLALVGAVWLLGGLPKPADTMFWNSIYDAGHAPLFGFVALCVLSLIRIVLPNMPGPKLYLFAFATTTILGAVTELAQFFSVRDADAGDFIRNAAGAAAFLAFRAALEKRPGGGLAISSRVARTALLASASILMLAVFAPVAVRVADYRERDRNFPILCEFESRWERTFIQPVSAGLEQGLLPAAFGEDAGRRSGRWTLYSRPWPGLALREPFPDWTGYRALRFEVWSDLDEPVDMTLRAEDRRHDPGADDRARIRFTVEPGWNEIRVDLDRLRDAPPSRALDMDEVALVMIYARSPEEPFTLWIDSVRLE
jgi:hypothetical protein